MTWTGRPIRTLILPGCAIGIAFVAYLASTVARDVYYGIPSSIAVSALEPTCQPAGSSTACTVDYERLNPGRFYLRTRGPAASVTVVVRDPAQVGGTRALLVRAEEVGRLTIDSDESSPDAAASTHEVSKARTRTVISLPQPAAKWNRITFTPNSATGAVVIRELGFFATDRDLRQSARQPFQSISAVRFYSTVAAALTLAVCAFIVLAAWMAPQEMYRPIPWLLTLLCLSVCILELGTTFSPYWSFDLRSFYGEELIGDTGTYAGEFDQAGNEGRFGIGDRIRNRIQRYSVAEGRGLQLGTTWFAALAAWTALRTRKRAWIVVLVTIAYQYLSCSVAALQPQYVSNLILFQLLVCAHGVGVMTSRLDSLISAAEV